MQKVLLCLAFTLSLCGCADSGSGDGGFAGPIDGKPGTFSVHEAAGNADSTCLQIADGSALNGNSYNYTFALGGDGTYNFYVSFYIGTACEFGGTEILSMEQGGTYQINAGNGANILTFTQSSDVLLTVYGGSAPGSAWAGYLNANCGTPGLKFSSSSTITLIMSGRTCGHANTPNFQWPEFPLPSGSSKTLGVFSANPHTLTIAKPATYWLPGSKSTLPARANLVFSYF
jgi:hypothetical protein